MPAEIGYSVFSHQHVIPAEAGIHAELAYQFKQA
jgi:hypothetical protein